jgi:uncharacterized oxidoreductase
MADTNPPIRVPVARLQSLIAAVFAAAGCPADEAERIARYLLSANLAGHDSHGVIRTPRYVQWLQEGKVLAGQSLTMVQDGPVHATVDGNWGFGQTIGPLAVDLGIGKARAAGLSVIALRRSGHLGRIGDWAERTRCYPAPRSMVATFTSIPNDLGGSLKPY